MCCSWKHEFACHQNLLSPSSFWGRTLPIALASHIPAIENKVRYRKSSFPNCGLTIFLLFHGEWLGVEFPAYKFISWTLQLGPFLYIFIKNVLYLGVHALSLLTIRWDKQFLFYKMKYTLYHINNTLEGPKLQNISSLRFHKSRYVFYLLFRKH